MDRSDAASRPRRAGSRGPARVGSVNLRDVAAHAGVSPATASRVFAGSENVQASTKARVLASAEALGYAFNGLARAMTGRGPQTIAFIVRAMIGPTFAALAAGAERVASEHNHLLLMSTTQGDPDREQALIRTLREQRVRAVLLVGSTETDTAFRTRVTDYARSLGDIDAPLILCGRPPIDGAPSLVSVDYDQAAGMHAAVNELTAAGHTRIAYIGAGRGMTTAELRMDGFTEALTQHGLPIDPELIRTAENAEEDGARAASELLALDAPPTAIVTMTDNIAVGIYRATRSRGLLIPRDLSVVGFDDVPMVADLSPGLTTVHPPFYEVGVRAAEIALRLAPVENVCFEPSLVRRGSVAVPA